MSVPDASARLTKSLTRMPLRVDELDESAAAAGRTGGQILFDVMTVSATLLAGKEPTTWL